MGYRAERTQAAADLREYLTHRAAYHGGSPMTAAPREPKGAKRHAAAPFTADDFAARMERAASMADDAGLAGVLARRGWTLRGWRRRGEADRGVALPLR